MKISIKKRTDKKDEYDLVLFSGHFTGVLEHISKESLNELENGIHDVLSESKGIGKHLEWNPRSMKHEYVED